MIFLGSMIALATAAPPPQGEPPSPARIQELVKKLEVPTRRQSDRADGPPDYPWPTFNYRWHYGEVANELKRAGDAAVPALLALLNDKTKPGQARAQAVLILVERLVGTKVKPDPKIVAALNAAFQDKDPALRYGVLDQLNSYGLAWHRNIWENLKKGAEQERKTGRRPAEHSSIDLLNSWPPPEERSFTPAVMDAVLPSVVALLGDDHPQVVECALRVIHSFGRPKTGVPELLALLRREDPALRATVAWALAQVGPGDAAAAKAVADLIDPKQPLPLYAQAAQAIGQFGPEAKVALPQLIEAMKDDRAEPEVAGLHDGAARALGNIGPDAKAAVPVLLAALATKFYPEDVSATKYYRGNHDEVLTALDRIEPAVGKKARAEHQRKLDEYDSWLRSKVPPPSPVLPPPHLPPPTDGRR